MSEMTIRPLLPVCTALPVWRCVGIRALETRLQAQSATPLMGQAGLAVARLALAVAPHARRIWIVAGPGNNGGDGLEAAMHLHRWGKSVQVVHLHDQVTQLPIDAQRAFERARQAGVPIQTGMDSSWPQPDSQDLCIDALLGIGASRAPEGEILQAINWLNAVPAQVLAIDIPTGLNADSGQPLGTPEAIVRADHTLTLLAAKPGMWMGHGRDACGQLWLAPLGLPTDASTWCTPDAELNATAPALQNLHASHKGSHGDVAVVGGESEGLGNSMRGAALLAAQTALHGGAGRVMLCLLGSHHNTLAQTASADLMLRELHTLKLAQLTVVAGCGGGQAIAESLGQLLQHSARLVLDADALNRVAEDPWLQGLLAQRNRRRQPTLLTPHPLEAARLLACTTAEVQANRLQAAARLVQRFDCCVVLKGSGTVVAAPGHLPRINPTGNGRLAIGGTGDLLAGLTGARLARSGNAWKAACEAVWSHGQAADEWPAELALSASRLSERLR